MSIQTFMTVLAVLFATLVVSDHRLGLSDQLGVGLAYSYVLASGVCLAIAQPMRQALIANTVPAGGFGKPYSGKLPAKTA